MPEIPHSALLAAALVSALSSPHASRAQAAPSPRSATLARDINGFRLGMTVAEARKLAPVSLVGGYQYEAKTPGLDYNFEVTPRGRIYRVTSSQQLGRFEEDRNFLTTLRTRLTAKYGRPSDVVGDSFGWSLIEPVADAEGRRLPFKTMWMDAHVSQGGSDTVSLEMTMIDFRILWADQDAEYVHRASRLRDVFNSSVHPNDR